MGGRFFSARHDCFFCPAGLALMVRVGLLGFGCSGGEGRGNFVWLRAGLCIVGDLCTDAVPLFLFKTIANAFTEYVYSRVPIKVSAGGPICRNHLSKTKIHPVKHLEAVLYVPHT